MRASIGLMIVAGFCLSAAEQESYFRISDSQPNDIVGQVIDATRGKEPKGALFGVTSQIFPQVVSGGGWETVIVIVNMSSQFIDYQQRFFNERGAPLPITFRTVPDLRVSTTSVINGGLGPGNSFNFSIFDATPQTQVGWATLNYDMTLGRLGAYAIMRQRTPVGQSEALVPLSGYDDTRFYLPIDNIQGFTTAIAIVNPASNLSNTVFLTFLDLNGQLIGKDAFTIVPSGHVAFAIADRYPFMANRLGTVLVESSVNRLSAMGLRFNPNFAFSSVPIMNWSGILQ